MPGPLQDHRRSCSLPPLCGICGHPVSLGGVSCGCIWEVDSEGYPVPRGSNTVAAICNGSWEDGVGPWPGAFSVGNQRPPAAGRGEDLLTCGDVETNPGPHSVLHPTVHHTSPSLGGLPALPSKGEHHWVRTLPMDGDVERNPGPTSAPELDWGHGDLMVEVEVDVAESVNAEPVNAELQTLLDALETGVEAASQQVHDPAMLGVLSGLFLDGLNPVATDPPLSRFPPHHRRK